ncbi:FIST N-terminal domain-containing protein [Oleispirillum naphthae]|uniref:FIST N-terminal domain-containing protein n=1 Tax=Oleispirillum naphthae TaxID=2838853 RepID=UPI003082624F
MSASPRTADAVRVFADDGGLASIDASAFRFGGRPAALALAFVSPFLDFADVTARLAALAGETPLVALSTAGELVAPTPADPLYREADPARPVVAVQAFSPELFSAVAVRALDLQSADLRRPGPVPTQEARIAALTHALSAIEVPFSIDARDTLCLACFDGLSCCEDKVMQAVYRSGRFPCLFVGGSAGGSLSFDHTWLFDGGRALENHAVLVFLKLAPGKRYGVLKSQNFHKTDKTFVAVDADPDRRALATVMDAAGETARPAVEVLAEALGTTPAGLGEALSGRTFGIEVDDEIFVRSISHIDAATGLIHFFCDVNPGDQLILLEATDFVAETRADVARFLAGKPPPLGVILNDCILRRLNNAAALAGLTGLWPCPAAGLSTFGELLGININQTLTAVAFFDAGEGSFSDDFVERFPVHYARFQEYFTRARLRRVEIVNRLRAEMTRHLARHLGASPELAGEIEGMLAHAEDLHASLDNIRATIAREVEAEQRAHRAEQQLGEAIEAISEGFALYDAEDRLVLANSRIRRMFPEVPDAFAIGRTFAEIVAFAADQGMYDYAGMRREKFVEKRLAAHKAADGHPTLQRMSDGTWLISRENRTRDGGVVGIRTDVTALKEREAEMEALKSRYELILESAGDGIVGIDAAGGVRFANPAAARMLGAEAAALLGRPFGDILGGAALPAFPLHCKQSRIDEMVCRRTDGESFIAEYTLTPICENKNFAGAVLVFRDISLRKQYEESIADHQKLLEQEVAERTRELSQEIAARVKIDQALQESRRRLLGITESLFEGVLLVDRFGIIVFANPSAHRWLEADSLLERLLDDVVRLEAEGGSVGSSDGPLVRVIDGSETLIDDDAVLVTASGRRIAMAYAAAPLDEGGRTRIAVISFRGIDAIKEAQREAMQASRLASVGQLAAGVAHEINTPIQYVGDNLRYIQDTFPDIAAAIAALTAALPPGAAEPILKPGGIADLLDDYPDAIGQALQGVGHVTHIVRSMKDFSHPGSAAKVGTDINHAIDSTVTVCRNEWKHVARVETDLDPELPKILGFPSDIHQVLLNLIVNAAHAVADKPDGAIGAIRISTRRDGDWVEIRVADDGPGVPKDLRERIFDPFFTTKGVGKGTGQGLSICLDIVVKKHGGKLFLDETAAPGATFVVRLPICEHD